MKLENTVRTEDLFRELGREERQEIKNFDIIKTPALEQIVWGFEKLLKTERLIQIGDDNVLSEVAALFLPETYSARDLECFNALLRGYEERDNFLDLAGPYLNALINSSNFNDITIRLQGIEEISGIGNLNKGKKITFIGDLSLSGVNMESGELLLIGNGGNGLGHNLEGGLIIAQSAERCVGDNMCGGKIVIRNGAGYNVGYRMRGGEICVGNAHTVGMEMRGGKILIQNSVESRIGYGMLDGEIIVNGNAGGEVGKEMYAGKIIVNGNVDYFIGTKMRGGEIIVRGNAKSYLAFHATGGTIYVEGDIESLGEFTERRQDVPGVNIFHKGKQIVENGRILDDRYKS